MEQLNLFSIKNEHKTPKNKVGRPTTITKEIVFKIKDDINKQTKNKKLKNKDIILKHSINERTFFRIKKGEYDYLFEKALEKSVDDFTLEFDK